jgi:hypothetical protein
MLQLKGTRRAWRNSPAPFTLRSGSDSQAKSRKEDGFRRPRHTVRSRAVHNRCSKNQGRRYFQNLHHCRKGGGRQFAGVQRLRRIGAMLIAKHGKAIVELHPPTGFTAGHLHCHLACGRSCGTKIARKGQLRPKQGNDHQQGSSEMAASANKHAMSVAWQGAAERAA